MKQRMHLRTPARHKKGVGLIEVMVAVLVLAVGLLGIAALQAVTLRNVGSSASRTQASMQIYSMMDIIRADRLNAGSYNTNIYVAGDDTGSDAGTVAGWLDGLKATVAPDAKGRIVCDGGSLVCTVGVQWSDAKATGDSGTPVEINITSQL